jgi:hypothetical protein
MSLIRKNKNKCVFLFLPVFGHKKRASRKNFFPVTNHTDQENFLKLPKKSFFSKIFIFTCFFSFFPMPLIRKNKKMCFFLVLPVFGHKKRTSHKNFFPVPNHTGQENFLTLPQKSFFSNIFIFTYFFPMSLIRENNKKVFFLVLTVFGHKKSTRQKNFFPVPNHTGQENFVKLPKKSFFSKIFIFTYFFSFFPVPLKRKNKKKVLFLVLSVFGHKKSTSQEKLFPVPNHTGQ